jgi:hypothetical protein
MRNAVAVPDRASADRDPCFFSSLGWGSWDVGHRPLVPERMPVLVDDDLLFDDGPGTPARRWP